MKKGNTPHQMFINSLKIQIKKEEPDSKKTSHSRQLPEDDDTEEDLQRLLEQKFNELFGTADDNE